MTVISFVRRVFTLSNAVFVVLLLVTASLFFSVFVCARISGTSMEPTLQDGQWLVGLRIGYHPFIKVSRGDIVTAYSDSLERMLVKRVIGMPGDVLQLREGQLYVNGELYREPYIYEPMVNSQRNNTPAFTVPEGHYYLMGDNRNRSMDSRDLGLFAADRLNCKLLPHHQVPLVLALLVSVLAVSSLPCLASDFVQRCTTKRPPQKRTPENHHPV